MKCLIKCALYRVAEIRFAAVGIANQFGEVALGFFLDISRMLIVNSDPRHVVVWRLEAIGLGAHEVLESGAFQ